MWLKKCQRAEIDCLLRKRHWDERSASHELRRLGWRNWEKNSPPGGRREFSGLERCLGGLSVCCTSLKAESDCSDPARWKERTNSWEWSSDLHTVEVPCQYAYTCTHMHMCTHVRMRTHTHTFIKKKLSNQWCFSLTWHPGFCFYQNDPSFGLGFGHILLFSAKELSLAWVLMIEWEPQEHPLY